jgi:7-cyano-7-deazaguanine reductase
MVHTPKEGKDFQQISIEDIRKNLPTLESFDFQKATDDEHWITISTPEFTAICPFSDYPDFGSVAITYVPSDNCLELKSFKLYINAFRDIKIFHESATELIFADFLKTVNPKKAAILFDMNVRGNVKTTCKKYHNCTKNDVEWNKLN